MRFREDEYLVPVKAADDPDLILRLTTGFPLTVSPCKQQTRRHYQGVAVPPFLKERGMVKGGLERAGRSTTVKKFVLITKKGQIVSMVRSSDGGGRHDDDPYILLVE